MLLLPHRHVWLWAWSVVGSPFVALAVVRASGSSDDATLVLLYIVLPAMLSLGAALLLRTSLVQAAAAAAGSGTLGAASWLTLLYIAGRSGLLN